MRQGTDSTIFGIDLLEKIISYKKIGAFDLGELFILLQGTYFKPLFLGVLLGIPVIFFIHYLIIGPMIFAHDRKKYMYLLYLIE